MILTTVPLETIDFSDHTFIFTYAPALTELEHSIRTVGILQPVILQTPAANGKHRIVSGYRRLLVAQNLHLEIVPAQLYQTTEKSDWDLFQLNFYENLGHRPFNTLEKAMIIHKLLQQFKIPAPQIVNHYLNLLGLGHNPKLLERYLPLLQLEAELQLALVHDTLGIDLALRLLSLTPADRLSFFQMIEYLRLGKNRQKEFLNLFYDISKSSGSSFQQVLTAIHFDPLKQNESTPTPLLMERVLLALRQLRYPQLTGVEQNFKQILKRLKLPPDITLTPPAYFEDTRFSIKFDFQNVTDYQRKIKFLTRLGQQPDLNALEHLA
ncbi:ParB N-terminal domain-containing protein [candidate division KSB1 bacterium]|nr:ParB N-terminal domain-containing protein [candidate division KSB1 bacterium]